MKRKKNKILVYFRNIYVIIGLIFFIWMVFLDTNSLVKFIGLKKKLDRLENEKTKLEIEILRDNFKVVYPGIFFQNTYNRDMLTITSRPLKGAEGIVERIDKNKICIRMVGMGFNVKLSKTAA